MKDKVQLLLLSSSEAHFLNSNKKKKKLVAAGTSKNHGVAVVLGYSCVLHHTRVYKSDIAKLNQCTM